MPAVVLVVKLTVATPLAFVVQEHAERLERLARQLARVRMEPLIHVNGGTLAVTVPLASTL